jgi:hypothetical protein
MLTPLSPGRVRAARIVAVGADMLQILLLPAFLPAALPPANNVIDVVVAVALVALVGWHWAFLPAFAAEMIPFVDIIPTWTAAVMIATRGASATPPVVVDVERPAAPGPPALPAADQSGPDGGPSGA